MTARERLLRELFSKPTVFGRVSDRLTRDWTNAELESNVKVSRVKRLRLQISYPFARVDTFIRQRWPRTKVKR